MASKSKEKTKKSTNEKDSLDLDNEIIIGIKTLPESEPPKEKKTTNNKKKGKKVSSQSKNKNKDKNKDKKKNKNKNKSKKQKTNKQKQVNKQKQEIELNLGIEDEQVKKKNAKSNKKKKRKKTAKQQEIARKKRKRIFRFVKWTSLVALIIGGTIYFMLSPYFNIESITTSGNEKITSEEIISLSGIQIEDNIFKISSSNVEQAVKENAYIDSVKLKRSLPSSVEIQVVERESAYMLTLGNAYVYISTQGYILEISSEALELPIITGYSTAEDQIQEGNRLCEEDLEKLNDVIQIIDSANNNEIGSLITKINIADDENYVLELESENKTVYLGDTSNLSTKMLYIKTVMENEGDTEGEIFVNTDLSNKGAIFREKV